MDFYSINAVFVCLKQWLCAATTITRVRGSGGNGLAAARPTSLHKRAS
jgi:hypothetical protein